MEAESHIEPPDPDSAPDSIPPSRRLVPSYDFNAYGRRHANVDEDPATGRKGRGTATALATATDNAGVNFAPHRSIERMAKFCVDISIYGSVRHACALVGISRSRFKDEWLPNDWFREQFESAKEDYNDRLREEISRRALEGTLKTKKAYYKGDVVDEYEEREYSDLLMIFLAKSKMPEFRDKIEVSATPTIDWRAAQDLLKGIPDDYKVGATLPGGGEPAATPTKPDVDGVYEAAEPLSPPLNPSEAS